MMFNIYLSLYQCLCKIRFFIYAFMEEGVTKAKVPMACKSCDIALDVEPRGCFRVKARDHLLRWLEYEETGS